MTHLTTLSQDLRRAIYDDLSDLNGSDPLPVEAAQRVFRNWTKIEAFDRACMILLRQGTRGRTDGALQDARNAHRDIDHDALEYVTATEAVVRRWTEDVFQGVDWS